MTRPGLVRIPRELVVEGLKTAPASFVLTPRNAQRRIHVGGDHVSFGLVAGPPNVHDCVNGRRSGNYRDYCNLIKLAQSFDIIHFIGNQPTPPIELPTGTRHLDCYIANVTYSDKVYHCTAIGRDRALDGIDIMAISRGKTREEILDDPSVTTIISVNSPRRFDRGDERRADDHVGAWPGGGRHTLHPDGGDDAGDHGGGADPAECRGAGGHPSHPADAAGRAGDLWRLHLQCRHAQRRAGLRHAGEYAGDLGRGAARALL